MESMSSLLSPFLTLLQQTQGFASLSLRLVKFLLEEDWSSQLLCARSIVWGAERSRFNVGELLATSIRGSKLWETSKERDLAQIKNGNFWWALNQVSLSFSDGLVKLDNVDFSLWWFARPVLCILPIFTVVSWSVTNLKGDSNKWEGYFYTGERLFL